MPRMFGRKKMNIRATWGFVRRGGLKEAQLVILVVFLFYILNVSLVGADSPGSSTNSSTVSPPKPNHEANASHNSPLRETPPRWRPTALPFPEYTPEVFTDARELHILTHKVTDVPFLIAFTTSWCPPCLAQMAELETITRFYGPAVRVIRVDFDAAKEYVPMYFVATLPTVIMVYKGSELYRGAYTPQTKLRREMNQILSDIADGKFDKDKKL
eukprot:GHVT01071776.1.p1 GENE.GHVT01071776.1~~GHVT01071776.1.p1  ORF type:complete len:214 (+),score=24.94 GHVT01071776.1:274-915(+)